MKMTDTDLSLLIRFTTTDKNHTDQPAENLGYRSERGGWVDVDLPLQRPFGNEDFILMITSNPVVVNQIWVWIDDLVARQQAKQAKREVPVSVMAQLFMEEAQNYSCAGM